MVFMENLRRKVKVRLVNNAKDYKKYVSKQSSDDIYTEDTQQKYCRYS